jgi:hypothetical protein
LNHLKKKQSKQNQSPGFDLADGRHIDDKFIAHEDPTQKLKDDTKKMIDALKAEAAGNNAGITVKHHSVKTIGNVKGEMLSEIS